MLLMTAIKCVELDTGDKPWLILHTLTVRVCMTAHSSGDALTNVPATAAQAWWVGSAGPGGLLLECCWGCAGGG